MAPKVTSMSASLGMPSCDLATWYAKSSTRVTKFVSAEIMRLGESQRSLEELDHRRNDQRKDEADDTEIDDELKDDCVWHVPPLCFNETALSRATVGRPIGPAKNPSCHLTRGSADIKHSPDHLVIRAGTPSPRSFASGATKLF
jgi:hypothetical protein